MKKIKMVYLSLLGAWLLVCAVRMVLPWLRNDDEVEFLPGNYWACGYAGNEEVGDLPASIYAELNTRLEAVQPGIRVFFSPWYEGHFNCQSVVTCSLREGKPVLPCRSCVHGCRKTTYWSRLSCGIMPYAMFLMPR